MENMNKLITSKESEPVIKKFPTKKSKDQMVSLMNFTNQSKIYTYPSQSIQKIEEKGALPKFYKIRLTLIPKLDKNTISNNNKNYRSVLLINIDANTFNKILTNRMQQYIIGIIQHDQVGYIAEMQGGSTSISVIPH